MVVLNQTAIVVAIGMGRRADEAGAVGAVRRNATAEVLDARAG